MPCMQRTIKPGSAGEESSGVDNGLSLALCCLRVVSLERLSGYGFRAVSAFHL